MDIDPPIDERLLNQIKWEFRLTMFFYMVAGLMVGWGILVVTMFLFGVI